MLSPLPALDNLGEEIWTPTGTAWWCPLATFARTPRYALPRSRFLYRERRATESCFCTYTGPARLPDLSPVPLGELPDQALVA